MLARQNISSTCSVGTGSLEQGQSNLETDLAGQDSDRNATTLTDFLPNEIIGLIFRECLRGETIYLPICYSCSTVTMPWVLGQVCSTWKAIVENDPGLWSSLTLSYTAVFNREAFTQRVKDVIFPRIKLDSISLTCFGSEWMRKGDNPDAGGVITNLVMPNLARFRQLSLSMPHVALKLLINSPPGSITFLESLELEFLRDPRNHPQYVGFRPSPMTAFKDAPNLREVCLRGLFPAMVASPNFLALPWGRLTKLKIAINIYCPAVIGFLPYCTQLIECTLSVNGYANPESSTIRLPQLRLLSLAIDEPRVCEPLLGALVLPALKRLTLHLRLLRTIAAREIVLALIVRSGCMLEHFEVTSPYTRQLDDDISALLEAMPHLRKLYIPIAFSLPIPIMKRMITGELVPHLEAMHCAVESFPMALDLLEVRRSGKSPGALAQYGGIRCALLGTPDTMECKCNF